jgi:hypothetical protein
LGDDHFERRPDFRREQMIAGDAAVRFAEQAWMCSVGFPSETAASPIIDSTSTCSSS